MFFCGGAEITGKGAATKSGQRVMLGYAGTDEEVTEELVRLRKRVAQLEACLDAAEGTIDVLLQGQRGCLNALRRLPRPGEVDVMVAEAAKDRSSAQNRSKQLRKVLRRSERDADRAAARVDRAREGVLHAARNYVPDLQRLMEGVARSTFPVSADGPVFRPSGSDQQDRVRRTALNGLSFMLVGWKAQLVRKALDQTEVRRRRVRPPAVRYVATLRQLIGILSVIDDDLPLIAARMACGTASSRAELSAHLIVTATTLIADHVNPRRLVVDDLGDDDEEELQFPEVNSCLQSSRDRLVREIHEAFT